MGMLCIFVGDILQFFRKGDTGGEKNRGNIESFVSRCCRHQATHLAVLMGLGSKLPCASSDACFSRVAPRLASTKSGGRAPAMAHRHALAILKSSASYFCKHRHTRGGGYKRFNLQLRFEVDPVKVRIMEDDERGGGIALRWPVTN